MPTSAQRSAAHLLAVMLLILTLASITSCRKSATSASATSHRAKIDACSLITKEEIQAIQGSAVKDQKGSEQADGHFRIAQCFYSTETFNKSVSLALTQTDAASPGARDPKDYWKETFGRYEGKVKEEEGDEEKKKSLGEQEREEEGEKARPPKKLDGVGDAAYWTANRMGGALYILKDDVYMRISVGGPESEEAMINRCKALAEKALSRL